MRLLSVRHAALVVLFLPLGAISASGAEPGSSRFTPLVPAAAPTIIASSRAYPGGRYEVHNLLDGRLQSEYSSASKGTETFIDFDFGKSIPIAGFKHIDRHDPATVDTSRLTFSDTPDFARVITTMEVGHAGTHGGITQFVFPSAVIARYVRWQVIALGPNRHSTVGGSEIGFFSVEAPDATPVRDEIAFRAIPAVLKKADKLMRPVWITVEHPYAEPANAMLRIGNLESIPLNLQFGSRVVEVFVPALETQTTIDIALDIAGEATGTDTLTLEPVRRWEVSFLLHSHTDIGYTHVQTEVEEMHWKYYEMAIDFARRTADYPPGAQFRWNTETMWAVDSYLREAPDEKRAAFLDAVRKGWIHLDALYGNELTALCRPEELMRLTGCARNVAKKYDLTIDSAMISDVPGCTWGIVPVLAHSGIKYLSIGPNHVHRIGYTLEDWGDRPFYWRSPSGQEKVLCWMAGKAYSWFHGSRVGTLTAESDPDPFFDYLDELTAKDYPYDMIQVRYSIGGDNGPPDQGVCEFVKAWNAKYVWPRMAITTTSRMMHDFERVYGEELPEIRGDFTPYWEDGAGSSARETAMTRTASERLVQAEALWAILNPGGYPADEFYTAWRDAVLYNEHTWGSHCSISRPDDPFTLSQWEIKQAFAVNSEKRSQDLQRRALEAHATTADRISAVDVYNTSSWPRTDVVALKFDRPLAGQVVEDAEGKPVASQQCTFHRGRQYLTFLAQEVPPLGAKRFHLKPGKIASSGSAEVEGNSIANGNLRLTLNSQTGAIESLTKKGIADDLVAGDSGVGLNDFFYVAGRDPNAAERNGPVGIQTLDDGPLVASVIVVSNDVPGCGMLGRVYRVFDGIDRVDVINIVNRGKILSKNSIHFGFAFNVPDGVMRVDVPWAVVRPEIDQLPGACKNYFTVGRWVDVSNDQFGVIWATLDAPMVELGAITVDVPSPFDPKAWIRNIEPTDIFYSYVMNNYWETNYKASQEGVVAFHYSIAPHKQYDPTAAARFGIERSQPLIPVPVSPAAPQKASRLRVEPSSVLLTSLKPSDDAQALMVRLWNTGDIPAAARIIWSDPAPNRVSLSSPGEEAGEPIAAPINLPPSGIVTLRAELLSTGP